MTVANGKVLRTQEVCKAVNWESQGLKQTTNFLVLPLRGCDLVLGVQWLQTLGPITWDFTALTMQFMFLNQWFTLQGLQGVQFNLLPSCQQTKIPIHCLWLRSFLCSLCILMGKIIMMILLQCSCKYYCKTMPNSLRNLQAFLQMITIFLSKMTDK